MSEQLSVSPLLDGFTVGSPVSKRHGAICYPAVKTATEQKYILKAISVPASQTQLEALLITGACKTPADAADYFHSLTDDIVQEADFLQKMSQQRGFLPYDNLQIEPMGKNLIGYHVYMLSTFRLSLERYLHRRLVTHLEAVNLGIDLCEALAACRKEGMLYTNLKPSNIFISTKKEYAIGDLGFVPLRSLKYSSMPAKSRSRYCPPELMDDMAVLNDTADTYALGMILYQLFNNGELPADAAAVAEPPCNADPQMADIILKACSQNPGDRWSDPEEMGKALIAYMQTNTINDTPLMTPAEEAPTAPTPAEESREQPVAESADPVPSDAEAATAPELQPTEPPAVEQAVADTEDSVPIPPPVDDNGNVDSEPVSVTDDVEMPTAEAPQPEVPVEIPTDEAVFSDAQEETTKAAPEALTLIFDDADNAVSQDTESSVSNPSDFGSDVSPDVQTLFTESDASPLDEPESAASASEVSEIPLPAEEPPSPPADDSYIASATAKEFAILSGEDISSILDDDTLDSELEELQQLLHDEPEPVEQKKKSRKKHPNLQPVVIEEPKKKRKSPVAVLSVILVALLIAVAVFWVYLFYHTEYLKTVDNINITGSLNEINVAIDSDIPDNLLNVTCTDTYGHTQRTYVRDGVAVFTGLSPNSLYKIQVEVNGAHKLTGTTSGIFTTESVTNVVSFTAYAGKEDGSAILNLITEGHEPSQWQVFYSAPGEPELGHTFSGHSSQISNLVLGKEYTFRLETAGSEPITGQTEAKLLASRLVIPMNLSVVSCENGQMVIHWDSTEAAPAGWRAYCTGQGYEQMLECGSTEATFTGIDSTKTYTVEVIANGMGQSARLNVSANPITITAVDVDSSNPNELLLSWEYNGNVPEGGWLVQYTLDKGDMPTVINAEIPRISVAPRIPGAEYHFSIQAAGDTTVFNNQQSFRCPEADTFLRFGLLSRSIDSRLLVTPENADWSANVIGNEVYTTQFAVGQPISVVLHCNMDFYLTDEDIELMYVFRDQNGSVLSELVTEQSENWRSMWFSNDYHYAELDIPVAPSRPGNYTLTLYLDGAFLNESSFTIY